VTSAHRRSRKIRKTGPGRRRHPDHPGNPDRGLGHGRPRPDLGHGTGPAGGPHRGRPLLHRPHRGHLSGIAQRFYGHAGDWPYLYRINRGTVSDPNLIYTGEVLRVPTDPPASVLTGSYRPRHARAAHRTATAASSSSSSGGQQAVVTSSSGRGVSCTGSGGTLKPLNYGAIVTFLTAHGYSDNAAAGIAGNIYAESGGNPESVGDGGGGLIGWTPLPGGYVTGNPAADLQTQLNAILRFNQIWAQYIPTLNAAGSPAQAAGIYVTDFERAGIPAYSRREAAAGAVAAACGL
jgi:hypothetical protein